MSVIAHRLSTTRHIDRAVFIEVGPITELGSHDPLMEIEGGADRRSIEPQRSGTGV